MATACCAIALLFLLLHCSGEEARAQTTSTAAAAPPPGPAGPPNATAVLEKAGQFTILIRLLKSTQVGDQINTQLNSSNNNGAAGITLFAPTDNAFAGLPAGTLNSLSDQQKVALVQFHVLPTFLSLPQFQTASNPLRTQAGDAGGFSLNVTTSAAGNQVNISTGVVDATITNTLFSAGGLAVYQVDQVLQPEQIFGHVDAPAPAAAPPKPKKGSAGSPSEEASGPSVDASAATALMEMAHSGMAAAALAAGFLLLVGTLS